MLRGSDSVGVVTPRGISKVVDPGYSFREEVFKNFLKNIKRKPGDNILMHHRKGTIGAKTEKNAHPFSGNKFSIVQNGTNKLIQPLARYINIEEAETDTETILNILESQCNVLEDSIPILQAMSRMDTLGIIFLVEKKTSRIMLYSDSARCIYVTKKDDSIESIANYGPEEEDFYYASGNMIFDFSGKIISDNLKKYYDEKKKEAFEKQKELLLNPVVHSPQVRYSWQDDDYEDYYHGYSGRGFTTNKIRSSSQESLKEKYIKNAVSPYFKKEKKRLTAICKSFRTTRVLEVIGTSCPKCNRYGYLVDSPFRGFYCKHCYEEMYSPLVSAIRGTKMYRSR